MLQLKNLQNALFHVIFNSLSESPFIVFYVYSDQNTVKQTRSL